MLKKQGTNYVTSLRYFQTAFTEVACMAIGAIVSATALSFALFSIWQNMFEIAAACTYNHRMLFQYISMHI